LRAASLGLVLSGTLALLAWTGSGPAEGAQVRAIRVAPGDQTAAPQRDLQYTAEAEMSDGSVRDVTSLVIWASDDTDLARFDADIPGRLRTRKPGRVTIHATLSGKRGAAVVTIDPGAIARLITRPRAKKVEIDRPRSFTARLVYESGYQKDVTADVYWSSSNKTVARVSNRESNAGRVVPHDLGITTIQARYPGGLTNTDGETRVLPPIERVRFEEANVVLGLGMSTDLRVVGYHGDLDVRSSLRDDLRFSTVGETSIIDLIETGRDAGHVTALRNGIAKVKVYDQTRKIGTNEPHAIPILVGGVLEDLEVLPNPLKVNAGDTRNASVIGILSSGLRTANLRKLVEWLVEHPKTASVGNGSDDIGEVKGLEAGTTTLMARYDEFDVVSTEVDNLVVRARVTSLEMEPPEVVLGLDLEYLLRAYGKRDDGTRSNISGNVDWSSEPGGIVSIDASGRVTALANGVATVTAVDPKTGLEAAARVTVAGRLRSVDVSTVRVDLDDEKKAVATGRLDSGLRTSDLRLVVDWSVQNATIARVGNGAAPPEGERRLDPGEVLGLRLGTTTLVAVEPTTGIRSKQTGNVTVRSADSDSDSEPAPGPAPTPAPNPRPPPAEPPAVTILHVAMERGNDGQVQTGQTVNYKARATQSDGQKKNVSDKCEWSVDDPTIATVDNLRPKKGGVTGVAIGTTTVRFDCDGHVGAGVVDVVGDVILLTIEPGSFSGEIGSEKQLRVRVRYSNGDESYVTREVEWNTTNPDVATVTTGDLGGRVRFHALGEALIFAIDSTGHVATSTATVTD